MKWLRFEIDGVTGFGHVDGDDVVVFAGDLFGDRHPTGERVPLAAIGWLPPTVPRTIIGLWNNFHAAATKNGWGIPAEPLYFIKPTSCLCAHQQPIRAPRSYDGRVVYEGELAIVVGKETASVTEAEAPGHIFGYACANDVTAIDLLDRDPSFKQWTRAKGFDTFGVLGPVIDTGFDPSQGELVTTVNGRERQRYAFSDMVFSPASLVSRISRDMTLHPGDVILCGTSLGVLPMRSGTRVEVTVAGIGTLANDYVDQRP
jgi:2-keto-4-pentenoate hydratase/2-oxohepta-3-ene-1,7-dioic acid hydratase in catechol pathway